MKTLLLTGGRGVNMTPFSKTRPNSMIPIGGDYLIDHTLQSLKSAGIGSINMVVGHKSEVLSNHLGDDHFSDGNIHVINQGKSSTIGSAMLKAKDRFAPGDHFLLVYADIFSTSNIFNLALQAFGLHNEPTALICLTQSGEKYGNVYLDGDMKITKIIEKPKKKAGLGNYVLAGVYVLPYRFFGYLKKTRGNMELALQQVLKKETLRAAIWEDNWLDMAFPWDVLAANRNIMELWNSTDIHHSVKLNETVIKGPVKICKNAEICAGSVLEGPAYLGPGSFVGHNVLIRPNTVIGSDCVIGQGAELKNCAIFDNSTVGRLSFIGDSVVGAGVDIGAGTMTINRKIDKKTVRVLINGKKIDSGLSKLGAFIGDGALVGASNIIAPGTIIQSEERIEHNFSVPKSTGTKGRK
tara:strand:+ start:6605 stop:7831 length:1227 start_codon:yes stop_codon:yes gene_type:complete